MLKMAFKALYGTNFPDYLNLSLHKVHSYNLRSSVAPTIRAPTNERQHFLRLVCLSFQPPIYPGGTPHMKGVRMLVGNFELNP